MPEEIDDKINKIASQYTDPDDVAVIQEWRDRLRLSFEIEEYLDHPKTRDLVKYLKKRILDIREKLSTVEGLEKVDNLVLHARRDELASLLSLLAKDPKQERASIEQEVAEYL